MYTKIFLLVAISIIISSSVSIDFSHSGKTVHVETGVENNLSSSTKSPANANLPFGIDLNDMPHQNATGHAHQNNGDDDGKSHHFHFEQIAHRRRTIFFHAFARIILLLSFISSLISGFYMFHS